MVLVPVVCWRAFDLMGRGLAEENYRQVMIVMCTFNDELEKLLTAFTTYRSSDTSYTLFRLALDGYNHLAVQRAKESLDLSHF